MGENLANRAAKNGLKRAARGLANKLFGHAAELSAQKFLRQKGFEIVAANWSCKLGELDIVARKASVLHFCEVKASALGYDAALYLRPAKIPRLKRAIAEFLRANEHLAGCDFCLDLLIFSDGKWEHLENIYL